MTLPGGTAGNETACLFALNWHTRLVGANNVPPPPRALNKQMRGWLETRCPNDWHCSFYGGLGRCLLARALSSRFNCLSKTCVAKCLCSVLFTVVSAVLFGKKRPIACR